jgi:hypothetical protein
MTWPDELPNDVWGFLTVAFVVLVGGGGTWAWDKITGKKKDQETDEETASALDAVVESFMSQIAGIKSELKDVRAGMAILDFKYTLSLRTIRAYRAAYPDSGIDIPVEIVEDL